MAVHRLLPLYPIGRDDKFLINAVRSALRPRVAYWAAVHSLTAVQWQPLITVAAGR
jgi:hypothetical protein